MGFDELVASTEVVIDGHESILGSARHRDTIATSSSETQNQLGKEIIPWCCIRVSEPLWVSVLTGEMIDTWLEIV